ncbi:uncharacterized protein LOC143555714 [Bidens hawaiensis]|uniref:uncharacterized protein LOC143555714 n=1 Tax=Bidens hawaiensis TaxID=980011 RepID=UPI00404952D8
MGFSGEVVEPLGSITLPMTLKYGDRVRTVNLRFSVARAPLKYNIILGRTWMKALGEMASTTHNYLNFPTPRGVATVRSSIKIVAGVEANDKSRRGQKGIEEWIFNREYPEQTIKIGAQLSDKWKASLKEMLLHNMNFFAWKHEDMTRIPRTRVQHRLKEFHWMEPVKQKKRTLGPERIQVVLEETWKLLQAGIVP